MSINGRFGEVPLSVLDLAPVPATTGSRRAAVAEAIRGTVHLAQRAEALGYARYWVTENHGLPVTASSAPAVLIGGIAAATTTIRVGSGGVLLPNHAPFAIAEQFGTLVALHGNRIDLGVGRAGGSDPLLAAAFRRGSTTSADDHARRIAELRRYIGGLEPDPGVDRAAALVAVPGHASDPDLWVLGTSAETARLAGGAGLRFAFAHHLAPAGGAAAIAAYRGAFRPSRSSAVPIAMVSVNVVAADTSEDANREALPATIGFLRVVQGARPDPISIADAAALTLSDDERAFVGAAGTGQAIGDRREVRAALERLVEDTAADELMVQPIAYSPEGRVRTLEIVAGIGRPGHSFPSVTVEHRDRRS
jgi:luciferase family oxidoreductase group 1